VQEVQKVKKDKTSNSLKPSEYKTSSTVEILTRIKPGLAMKDIVEGMKNFYFDGTSAITYNDKVSILHPFKTDFQAFIHADTFFRLLSKLPNKTFEMTQKDNQILITSTGLDVKLASIIDNEVIDRIKLVKEGIDEITWKPLPENFIMSVTLCSFAASETELDTTLSCVKIENDVCVASDSKRIATAKLKSPVELMYIKASEIVHLGRIDPTHYGINNAWILFKNQKNCIFALRKIGGGFPEWKHLFDFEGSQVSLPQELLKGIDLAAIFKEDGEIPYLTITIENNVCNLSIKTSAGNLKYSAPIEYDKEAINFVINPDFLKEMMRFSTIITITDNRAKLETDTFSTLTALYSKEEDDEGQRYTRYGKKG